MARTLQVIAIQQTLSELQESKRGTEAARALLEFATEYLHNLNHDNRKAIQALLEMYETCPNTVREMIEKST